MWLAGEGLRALAPRRPRQPASPSNRQPHPPHPPQDTDRFLTVRDSPAAYRNALVHTVLCDSIPVMCAAPRAGAGPTPASRGGGAGVGGGAGWVRPGGRPDTQPGAALPAVQRRARAPAPPRLAPSPRAPGTPTPPSLASLTRSYYGAEQGLRGSVADNTNRQPLWEGGYSVAHPNYRLIRTLSW